DKIDAALRYFSSLSKFFLQFCRASCSQNHAKARKRARIVALLAKEWYRSCHDVAVRRQLQPPVRRARACPSATKTFSVYRPTAFRRVVLRIRPDKPSQSELATGRLLPSEARPQSRAWENATHNRRQLSPKSVSARA